MVWRQQRKRNKLFWIAINCTVSVEWVKVRRDGMRKILIGILHKIEEGKGRRGKIDKKLGQIKAVMKKRVLLKK